MKKVSVSQLLDIFCIFIGQSSKNRTLFCSCIDWGNKMGLFDYLKKIGEFFSKIFKKIKNFFFFSFRFFLFFFDVRYFFFVLQPQMANYFVVATETKNFVSNFKKSFARSPKRIEFSMSACNSGIFFLLFYEFLFDFKFSHQNRSCENAFSDGQSPADLDSMRKIFVSNLNETRGNTDRKVQSRLHHSDMEHLI